MRVGIGIGMTLGSRPWSPASLGSALLGWWDAENAGTITASGGAVSAWNDLVAGYSAVQSTGSTKPAYSATSFNNRPGLTFDGVDDNLSLESVPLATPCELWALVDQTALPADTGSRRILAFGGTTTATAHALNRAVSTGVNRAAVLVGDGATGNNLQDSDADFSGRHFMRAQIGASSTIFGVDAGTTDNGAFTPSIGSTRFRIGANTAGAASLFFQGVISTILVTQPLSTVQASALATWLNARK